ncbi:MAG: Crp/Fnr family transcriptional regulator [Nocardioides sp.]
MFRVRLCDKGEVIASHDRPEDRVHLVHEGIVGLRAVRGASAVLLALRGPGTGFGEGALMDGPYAPRGYSAVALTPTRVTELLVDDLDPATQDALLPLACRLLARHARDQEGRITYLRSTSVEQRVAGCLCELSELVGAPRAGNLRVVPRDTLTQPQMAQYVGCAREEVNRSIARMVARGWVEVSREAITLVDLPALESYRGDYPLVRTSTRMGARDQHLAAAGSFLTVAVQQPVADLRTA